MVASTDIKFYVHTNNNAPQIQNAYGSMIGVLDACLINGINIGAISSLTASGTTVTVLFSSAHNLMQYQVIKITGANQSEFNGEHRILTVPNAQSVTFELAAAPSVSTATGTIEASLPPLDWEKPFSSTNASGGGKAAYRSKNLLLSSRPFLRVVDELDPAYTATYAKYAKVGIVEDMLDIDVMQGIQSPFDSANPEKNWTGYVSGSSIYNGWAKWYYAKNGASTASNADNASITNGNRPWILIGDGDYFYILNGVSSSDTSLIPYGFGNFKSYLDNDFSNSFLSASLVHNAHTGGGWPATNLASFATATLILQRDYKNTTPITNARVGSINPNGSAIVSGLSNYVADLATSGYVCFADTYILESNVIRGEMPNLFWVFQNKPLPSGQTFEKNKELFIAPFVASEYNIAQIILKVGEVQ